MPVGHENIFPPIVVQVCKECSPADIQPGCLAVSQSIALERKSAVLVVHGQLVGLVRGGRIVEIEPTVVVKVAKVRAHGALLNTILIVGSAGQYCNFLESSLTLVVIEQVGGEVIGHKDIRPAVIIIVSKNYSHTVESLRVDASFGSHIPEVPLAVIEKQSIAGARQPSRTAEHIETSVGARGIIFRHAL